MLGNLKGAALVAAGLGLSVVAWRTRRRWREDPATGKERVAALLGAAALGLACPMVTYPFDERTRIVGFPFPSAFLQLSKTGHWQDFIGITTPLFLGVNAAIGIALGYGLGRACAARWSAPRDGRAE